MNEEKNRPADKQRPYICQPRWAIGLIFQITGSIGDFTALAFAPQSLCAPVGGCTIVVNMFMAEIWLGEKMAKLDYVATCIVGCGVILSAYFADKSEQCFELQDLLDLYTTTSFLIYGGFIIVTLFALYTFVSMFDRIRATHGKYSPEYMAVVKRHRLFIPLFSSMVGSQSIIFAKSIAELIEMTARGNNQFFYWQTYLMIIGMITTIFTQIHWLAQGLKHFDAVYCIPIFQAGFITFASFGGGIYFQEFWNFNLEQMIGFPISILLIGAGVFLLSFREVTPVDDKVELLDAIAQEEASHVMTDVDHDANDSDHNVNDGSSPTRQKFPRSTRKTSPPSTLRITTTSTPPHMRGGPMSGRRTSAPPGTPKAWIENGLKNGGNGVSILYAAREIKRHLGGRRRHRRGVGPSSSSSEAGYDLTSPREHISVSSITSLEMIDSDDDVVRKRLSLASGSEDVKLAKSADDMNGDDGVERIQLKRGVRRKGGGVSNIYQSSFKDHNDQEKTEDSMMFDPCAETFDGDTSYVERRREFSQMPNLNNNPSHLRSSHDGLPSIGVDKLGTSL